MTSEDLGTSFNHVPRYAKAVMFFQSMIILFYVFWTYEEYTYNQYFQDYVNNSIAGGAFTIIALSTVGIFSAIASGLFMKLRGTRKELEQIHNETVSTSPARTTNTSSGSSTSSGLEPHVEEHLISMIRKSTPADTLSASTMPVLKREEPSGQAR
ncbi:MAG TPA: hypothetical protein VFV92_09565 [Candidatus Bathyarchaeia archaeon]|nr:hypothetical protein [Candidatus Bathyarchaeia archaeon]